MEKNLFQQAKDMMNDFMGEEAEHEGHGHRQQDKEAVRRSIQNAYKDATPEEEQELRQLEQHLDEKMELD